MGERNHFDEHYRETARLKDGTSVHLRLVLASDKTLLAEGLEQMSPQSRYHRFFTEKKRLSEKELWHFTEIDGVNHFAIGALRQSESAAEEGIGVARFVRYADRSDTAEIALAVIDEVQGKGLGSLLLARLIAAAREREVHDFHADVLDGNLPMKALIRKFSADVRVEYAGEILAYEFLLPDLAPDHVV